jgi:hypothetical protein
MTHPPLPFRPPSENSPVPTLCLIPTQPTVAHPSHVLKSSNVFVPALIFLFFLFLCFLAKLGAANRSPLLVPGAPLEVVGKWDCLRRLAEEEGKSNSWPGKFLDNGKTIVIRGRACTLVCTTVTADMRATLATAR